MHRQRRYQCKSHTNECPLLPFTIVSAGAVYASSSEFGIDGNAMFTHNSAAFFDGGENGAPTCNACGEVQVTTAISGIVVLKESNVVVIM